MLMRKILKYISSISLILFMLSYLYPSELPVVQDIDQKIVNFDTPNQNEVTKSPISTKIKSYDYQINPQFSYDLYGLVVSQYDSENWIDFTHKEDPGQSKDVCVVWGENISNGAYKKAKYNSGEFTCYYRWSSPIDPPFDPTKISNNHLLPSNLEIHNKIKHVMIGDQIHATGYLVNYNVKKDDQEIFSRHTSTTRTDTGNGACEIIYVTQFDVIKSPNHWLSLSKQISLYTGLITGSIWLLLVLFVAEPAQEIS